MASPLSPGTIIKLMLVALPQSGSDLIKTPVEVIGLAVHACMRSLGFKLDATGPHIAHVIQQTSHQSSSNDTSTEAGAEDGPELKVYADNTPLPQGWTPNFSYSHEQSSMNFLVSVSQLSTTITVRGVAVQENEDEKMFKLKASDVLAPNTLPVTFGSNITDEDRQAAIAGLFTSQEQLEKLIGQVKTQLVQKIAPGIQVKGYVEEASTERATSDLSGSNTPRQQQQQQPPRFPNPNPSQPFNPYAPGGRQPNPDSGPNPEMPPDFEDPYDLQRPLRHPNPNLNPLGNVPLGHNDLYPPGLGPHDPFRPSLGPGGIRPMGGGGMHPTFDDPLFAGRGPHGYDDTGGQQGGGQVPPGARYDPFGPGDPNIGGPGQFPGRGHPFGRGGGGGLGGMGGGGFPGGGIL